MGSIQFKTRQSILVLRNEGYSMRDIARNGRSRTKLCTIPFTEQHKLALTRIERGVGGPGAQLSKRTTTLVSSLRNRRLTSPQLAASLNTTTQNTSLNVNSEEAISRME